MSEHVQYQSNIYTIIVVIHGKIDSPPHIKKITLKDLGMLLIDEIGGLKQTNKEVKIDQEQNENTELENILEKFHNRFITSQMKFPAFS